MWCRDDVCEEKSEEEGRAKIKWHFWCEIFGARLGSPTNDQRPTTINDASKFVSLENVHSESTFCDNEAIID